MTDMVNHPPHYKHYEREVIELTERCDFCTGNAFKYILRAPFKGHEKEDLEKAKWYINRIIESGRDMKLDYEVTEIAKHYNDPLFTKVFQALYLSRTTTEWLTTAIRYIDDRISVL